MIYFTADWHLCESPERTRILDRYFRRDFDIITSVPLDCKSLFIVGDLFCNKAVESDDFEECCAFLKARLSLIPSVFLIRGNHDRPFDNSFFNSLGINNIIEEGEGVYHYDTDSWLTHYPTKSTPNCFNLVGHIHGAWKVQKNMLNVGVDVHQFNMVSAEKVKFYKTAIKDYYDDDVWCSEHESNSEHKERGKAGTYYK